MKKISITTIILLLTSAYLAFCQSEIKSTRESENPIKYAETITKADLSKHLHIIASDEMEGRLTGTEGQKKAAAYIANHFKNIGLAPPVSTEEGISYLQKFKLVNRSWKEVYVSFGEEEAKFKKDVFVLGQSRQTLELDYNTVFVGKGEPEDYNDKNVSGKAVFCLRNEDRKDEEKIRTAFSKGAGAFFMITGKNKKDFNEAVSYASYYLNLGRKELSAVDVRDTKIFYISTSVSAKIFNTSPEELWNENAQITTGQDIKAKAEMKEKVIWESENVLGFLEGTDKKEEVLVITAHYDHIGKNGEEINNGADDDGSGTVSILEIAEAFMEATKAGKRPRRSILFMTVAGEELGLYGSRYYTDYYPVFPLESTVADLNIDMIGRIGGDYVKKGYADYVYLIGSDKLSTDLHNLSEEVNKKYTNLKLDYKYNDERDPNRFYYRSDHYNFAKNGIPIIFYFNGTHEDYHQPTDTVDKIHFPKMEKIARLVFHTAWEIANREERLKVDKKKKK